MRWLFLFILTLNLAYAGWHITQSSHDDLTEVAAIKIVQPKNVQSIVLLSELNQPLASSEASVSEIADLTIKSVTPEPSEISAPDTGENVIAATAAESSKSVAGQAVDQVLVKTSAKTVETLPAGTAQIHSTPAASCYTLGPFRDLDKLRTLTREIKPYAVTTDFRGSEEKEPTLHWVYLKPEKNHQQAIATGKRLKAKKIKDFFIVRDGEKIHGLSLGYFRNEKGAYGLAEKVNKLGFEVIVEPVTRSHTLYWLDYQLAAGVEIPESVFAAHIEKNKNNKVSRLRRECDA